MPINALGSRNQGALGRGSWLRRPWNSASKLADGKTLDDLLVPAFAVVREAAKRVLGLRPFDVQLIGGMILHEASSPK